MDRRAVDQLSYLMIEGKRYEVTQTIEKAKKWEPIPIIYTI